MNRRAPKLNLQKLLIFFFVAITLRSPVAYQADLGMRGSQQRNCQVIASLVIVGRERLGQDNWRKDKEKNRSKFF